MLYWLVVALVAAAAAYQLLAIVAALRLKSRFPASTETPATILKPIRGGGPGLYEALRSNAEQQHSRFEMLLGFGRPNDPALPVAQRLASEFPNVRVIETSRAAPNGKVGVLRELREHAAHGILIVADSDIRVPPGYLSRVVAPLADLSVGLVTCVYRATADTWPGRFEALGVATDFSPSAMVAPLVGVDEFGLGATLAFRAADLDRIGGFEAIEEYLADDYQLGRRIHELGLKCVLSDVVVETHLGAESWRDAWRHQVRWARTIRVSKGWGYAGLPISNGGFWAVVAACAGQWPLAAGLMTLRLAMALIAGWRALGSSDVPRYLYLVPLRDLTAMVVWATGLFGRTVHWGDQQLRLTRDGRVRPAPDSR